MIDNLDERYYNVKPIEQGVEITSTQDLSNFNMEMCSETHSLKFTKKEDLIVTDVINIPLGLLTDFASNSQHFAMQETQVSFQNKISEIVDFILDNIEAYQNEKVLEVNKILKDMFG